MRFHVAIPPLRASGDGGRMTVIVTTDVATLTTTVQGPIVAPRAEGKPSIDGKLNEPCWEGAAKATGFVSSDTGVPAAPQTTQFLERDTDC